MDKKRNIELENWLIETTGEEMMANHLGPNWNRFHEECGFYPNISMTIADQVWEHQQKRIDELQLKISEDSRVLHNVIDIENNKCKKLQAKLDACQKLLEKWKKTGLKGASDYAVGGAHTRQECEDELEQALKGGEV